MNIYNSYGFVWISVLFLYELKLSSYNTALSLPLIIFLAISISASFILGALHSRSISKTNMNSTGFYSSLPEEKPSIYPTAFIAIGFIANFIQMGGIPLFTREYVGFSSSAEDQVTLGIPFLYAFIIAYAMFYECYLSAIVSKYFTLRTLSLYVSILLLFILNQSRGYVVYSILTLVIITYINNRDKLNLAKTHTYIKIAFLILLMYCLLLFIGIFGNIRSGYAWNDNSYIESLGHYSTWPRFFPKQLMWIYTYTTTPLANINLAVSNSSGVIDPFAMLVSVFPENFTKSILYTYTYSRQFIVEYLNASTGFSSPVATGGVLGLYYYFIFQLLYFYAFDHYFVRKKMCVNLSRSIMFLYSILGLFLNPYFAASTCFILPFLAIKVHLSQRGSEKNQDRILGNYVTTEV